MSRSIFAIAPDHEACLASLKAAGFKDHEISVLGVSGRTSARLGTALACGPLALLLQGHHEQSRSWAEMGIPTYHALRYEDALSHGKTVVAVHTDNGFEIETVSELLRDGGCEQVAVPTP